MPRKLYGRVYCVLNLSNMKMYVGQTIKSIHARWKHGHKSASPLGAAFRKYGADRFFTFKLGHAFSTTGLDILERKWIRLLNTIAPHGYNLTSGGRNQGELSKESKLKMRKSQKLSWKNTDKIARLSSSTKSNWKDPVYRMRQVTQISNGTKAARHKYSEAQKRNWKDPVYRENIVAHRRARKYPNDFNLKMSGIMTKWWAKRKLRSSEHRVG